MVQQALNVADVYLPSLCTNEMISLRRLLYLSHSQQTVISYLKYAGRVQQGLNVSDVYFQMHSISVIHKCFNGVDIQVMKCYYRCVALTHRWEEHSAEVLGRRRRARSDGNSTVLLLIGVWHHKGFEPEKLFRVIYILAATKCPCRIHTKLNTLFRHPGSFSPENRHFH